MRLLLDENLDWRLQRDLPTHQVESVPLIGWAGIENGELLRKAVEAGFDVLITMDSSMVHQQKIERYAIAVVALRAPSNRLAGHSSADDGASRVAVPDQVGDSDVPSLSTSQQQLVTTRKLWEADRA
jgi:hypothetical protein